MMHGHHGWFWIAALALALGAAGCPTEGDDDTGDDDTGDDDTGDDDSGDDDTQDPVYEISEPDGWDFIPPHAGLAAEQLYGWSDFRHPLIEPVVAAAGCTVTRTSYDPWDGPPDSTRTITWSSSGYEQYIEWDTDVDGVVDRWRECYFDGEGRPIRCEQGDGLKGPADEVTEWTYDDDGRLLTEEYSYGTKQVSQSIRSHTYDGEGRLIETTYWHIVDHGKDLYWSQSTSQWTWSEAGRVTHHRTIRENELDGITGEDLVYLHGVDGVPTRYDLDEGDDGWLDHVAGYTFDGSNRLVEDWYDIAADGVIDLRYTFSDFAVDLPQHVDVEEDAGFSTGTIDIEWDGAGHAVVFKADQVGDFGGASMHQVMEFDVDGNPTYLCQDHDLTQCAESEEWFTYEDGLLVLEERLHGDLEHTVWEWACP